MNPGCAKRIAAIVLGLMPAFLAMPALSAAQPDTAAPNLLSLSVSPTTVDLTAGPQAITVRIHVTDDLSGFESAGTELVSPTRNQSVGLANFRLVSGTALDGIYQGELTLPQFSEAGTWSVLSITLRDNARNQIAFTEADFVGPAFATHVEVTSQQDIAPPDLLALAVSPPIVDVSAGSQIITVTIRVTDDLSGLESAGTELFSPTRNQSVPLVNFRRVSGTALDGIYEGELTLPQFSEAGTWSILSLGLRDNARNQSAFTEADFIGPDFSTQVEVTSQQDITPPDLLALAVSPSIVDVSAGPQIVTVTIRVTDDLSGFESAGTELVSPTRNQSVGLANFRRVSGTALDGIYEGEVTLPQFSEPGTWRILSITLRDNARNQIAFTAADFVARGFVAEVLVTATPPPVLFLQLQARADIVVWPGPNNDAFDVEAVFTLGANSDGINPLSQDVTLTLGPASWIISAGSFRGLGSSIVYVGRVGPTQIAATFVRLSATRWGFAAVGAGAMLDASTNPVAFGLQIGNDTGARALLARIRRR